MNINLIGVPIFFGCDREGVELGPETLRENDIVNIIKKHGHQVYDLGDIYVPKSKVEDKFSEHNNMKYLSPIIEVNRNLANQVYNCLKADAFPFVLGGDHSLGLGSISGASKYFEDLAVIWVDAHGDINTHETSPSGNVHGMPLAAAMGLGHESLTDLYYKGAKVNPKNVYIIGARDLDEGEVKLIEDLNLNLWTTEDIKEKGVTTVVSELLNKLKESNIKNIHLSYDIDSLDADLVPGTGTPVKEGLTLQEVKCLLKSIIDTKQVTSMDFVELNSVIDKESQTLNIALELIDWIFSLL